MKGSVPDPYLLERLGVMTPFAAEPETPPVLVVLLVTAVTGRGHLYLALHLLGVARPAVEVLVGPVQLEIGL